MMGQRGRGSVHAILHSAIYVCTGWRDHAVHTVSTKCVVCAHLIIDICRQFNVWFLAQISRHLMHLYYQHLAPNSNGEGSWVIQCLHITEVVVPAQRVCTLLALAIRCFAEKRGIRLGWVQSKNGKVMNNVSQGRLCMHINTMCFSTCRTGGVTR